MKRTLSLSIWCITAAFGTYFCMYAFRKPFTVHGYTDYSLWGIGYKTILVTSQIFGYTLSKFIGIKIVAEMGPKRRAWIIVGLIAFAEGALLLFALVPFPFNFVCLFLNGLPLGMVFGLVLGFLEGRQVTEALTAGLCASFIVSSGATKSVGAYLMSFGVSEWWMPFLTGLLFVPPLLLFVWMLSRIPPPTATDMLHRTERVPMDRAQRWAFFKTYAIGLIALIAAYVLITILRSIRDDFAVEIWTNLGYSDKPSIFAKSEIPVMLGVMIINGAAIVITDNRRAFLTAMAISILGLFLVAFALVSINQTWLSGYGFMVLTGLGLYLPYVAVHTTVFERLIALTRDRGNIGYLMYLADAFGYLGYIGVMIGRGLFPQTTNFLPFYVMSSWIVALASIGFLLIALFTLTTRSEQTS